MRIALLAMTATFALAACDGGDPVETAMKEASAANHAATVKDGQVSAADHAAMGHSGTAGDQAFAASEAEMHRAMAAASGETLDQAYLAKMIAHHEGAIAMAEVALRDSRDPEVRRMAQAVVDAQTREIAEMKAWRPAAAPAN